MSWPAQEDQQDGDSGYWREKLKETLEEGERWGDKEIHFILNAGHLDFLHPETHPCFFTKKAGGGGESAHANRDNEVCSSKTHTVGLERWLSDCEHVLLQ